MQKEQRTNSRTKVFWATALLALTAMVAAPLIEAAPLGPSLKIINKPGRFKILKAYNSDAVLDKETGAIWARTSSGGSAWAPLFCHLEKIGGRYGWRMPKAEELSTLLDDTTGDSLPAGHPFQSIEAGHYWTQTNIGAGTDDFIYVEFGGSGGNPLGFKDRSEGAEHWCVRTPGGGTHFGVESP